MWIRSGVAVLAVVGSLLVLTEQEASAHAALIASDPLARSMLEAPPTAVRLTFSEEPQPSLSSIRVVDARGAVQVAGAPQSVPGDRMALETPLRPLARGVYTVTWRTVSRVDGHPTAGVLNFGVGVFPAAPASGPGTESSPPWSELVGRWLLIAGLVGLLGAACAGAARFGPASGGLLAAGAWVASLGGLVLLADGQRRNAAGSLSDLWSTPTGRALAWRAAAIVLGGAALAAGRRARGQGHQVAMWTAAGAAAAAMLVDVSAGHAAGAHSPRWASVAAQWAHFAAVGVWLGGLGALMLGLRGAPSDVKAGAVRRFSRLALILLLVVVVTGVARALGELSSWRDLTATGYGRAVLVKGVLVVGILALAGANRWRSVPRAATDLAPLRRLSTAEIVLAAGALGAAATLASLAPPMAVRAEDAAGLAASGSDFATSVRVSLRAQSASPGPNVFEVTVADYDTGEAVPADEVGLRFLAPDDPAVAPTVLPLRPGPDHSWSGSGDNLAFDGRWRVVVLVRRGSDSVTVPLELSVRGPPQFVSVERIPGRPVRYTVELAVGGYARVWADPQRPGASTVFARFFDPNGDPRPVDQVVLTTTRESGATQWLAVRRAGPGEFDADVILPPGPTSVAVVARDPDGTRLRATVSLEVDD